MHGLVYIKICVSVQTRVTGNSNTLIKMAELLQNLKDSFIFQSIYELDLKKIHTVSDLLLNISLFVSESQVDKSLTLHPHGLLCPQL